jgi:hypothetical protein
LGEGLDVGVGPVVGLVVALGFGLGFGFGVRVLTTAGPRVTSNCTSLGAEPRTAANTW